MIISMKKSYNYDIMNINDYIIAYYYVVTIFGRD